RPPRAVAAGRVRAATSASPRARARDAIVYGRTRGPRRGTGRTTNAAAPAVARPVLPAAISSANPLLTTRRPARVARHRELASPLATGRGAGSTRIRPR